MTRLVDFQNYVELEDMVHMVIKIENQLKRKGSSTWQNRSSGLSWGLNFVKKEEKQATAKPKIEQKKEATSYGNQGKSDSSTTQNHDIMCFKC